MFYVFDVDMRSTQDRIRDMDTFFRRLRMAGELLLVVLLVASNGITDDIVSMFHANMTQPVEYFVISKDTDNTMALQSFLSSVILQAAESGKI